MSMAIQILLKHTKHINDTKMRLEVFYGGSVDTEPTRGTVDRQRMSDGNQ